MPHLSHLLLSWQMDLSLLGATHMMVAIALPCKISSGICRKGQGNLMVHLLLKPSMVGWLVRCQVSIQSWQRPAISPCDVTCHVMIYIFQPSKPFLWGFIGALSILRHAILKKMHVVVMLLRGNTRLEVVIRLAEIFA